MLIIRKNNGLAKEAVTAKKTSVIQDTFYLNYYVFLIVRDRHGLTSDMRHLQLNLLRIHIRIYSVCDPSLLTNVK